MDSYKKERRNVFKLLPNLGVSLTLLCVNRAHLTWNFYFQADRAESAFACE